MKKMLLYLSKIKFQRLLLFGYRTRVPENQLLLGYFSYVVVGTFLLCLPVSQKIGISIIDNLFNATSALSTTGLITVSLADAYTLFGKLVILSLIQIGGIGYMTLISFILLVSTNHLDTDRTNVLNKEFTFPKSFELNEFIKSIILFTFGIELLGAIALSVIFYFAHCPQPIWYGIFHSISAFCTAGFGLYNDSFESFKFNAPFNIVLSLISFSGSMGFIVLFDVWQWLTKKKPFITFTSKIILWVTIILTIFGTLMIFFFEPSIRAFTANQKLLVSFFQAENALTTTGFNSIPIGILSEGILMILTILMYVGASPSGTGGGLKSTTLTGLIGYINSKLKRRHNVTFFHREIPEERVSIAINIFIIYTSVLFFGSCLLTFTEKAPLQNLLFEAASALGTVGLSVGVTNSLTFAGKIILTSLMFIGRAGVITIGTVVLLHRIRLLREGTKMEDLAV